MSLELLNPVNPVPPDNTVRVALFVQNPLLHASLRSRIASGNLRLVDDPNQSDVGIWEAPNLSSFPTLPETPPLVLAVIPEGADPMPFLAAGARGVLPRDLKPQSLHAAIHCASLGMVVLEDDFADAVVADWSPPKTPLDTLLHKLTFREKDVLELLAEGLSNRKIAEQLGVSAHTIKFHIDSLLSKLKARNRTQVVVKAIQLGLLRV